MREDLDVWLGFLRDYNGITLIEEQGDEQAYHFGSDASSFGFFWNISRRVGAGEMAQTLAFFPLSHWCLRNIPGVVSYPVVWSSIA